MCDWCIFKDFTELYDFEKILIKFFWNGYFIQLIDDLLIFNGLDCCMNVFLSLEDFLNNLEDVFDRLNWKFKVVIFEYLRESHDKKVYLLVR